MPVFERMHLEITIPCYNEEHRLEAGYAVLADWVLQHQERAKITVVIADNGSTDRTEDIARRLAEESRVPTRYLRLDRPGLALALRASWDGSKADVVGYCDTDMATDVAHLGDVLREFAVEEMTIVNGSRWLKESVVRNRGLLRTILSWTLHKGIRVLAGIRATDIACGFKFFRRSWYAEKSPRLTSERFFLGAELLWNAERERRMVKEIPVRWTDRPGSRIKIIPTTRDYWQGIRRLWRLKSRRG